MRLSSNGNYFLAGLSNFRRSLRVLFRCCSGNVDRSSEGLASTAQGNIPSSNQIIGKRIKASYELFLYGPANLDRREAKWKDVEAFAVKLKPEGYQRFPPRPFVMPCRALCGLDLKRVHFTCMFCRLRRVFAGKMTARNDCHTYSLIIMDHRPLVTVKDLLLRKLVLPIAEALAN